MALTWTLQLYCAPGAHNDEQLASLIRNGRPARGMPPSRIAGPEMAGLLNFLRTIQHRAAAGRVGGRRLQLQTTEGKTMEGQVLGEGFDDLQLRTDDQRVHLLHPAGSRFREVRSETDWPSYNGDSSGNR
jgi:alcohol dehydrogenase (cytochrome c)